MEGIFLRTYLKNTYKERNLSKFKTLIKKIQNNVLIILLLFLCAMDKAIKECQLKIEP